MVYQGPVEVRSGCCEANDAFPRATFTTFVLTGDDIGVCGARVIFAFPFMRALIWMGHGTFAGSRGDSSPDRVANLSWGMAIGS